MAKDEVIGEAKALFESTFSKLPEAKAYAPGRVNLLGEHTDYNGGVVFPMPLALGTAVAMAFGGAPGTVSMTSSSFPETLMRVIGAAPDKTWTDYILGPLAEFVASSDTKPGLQIAVASDLPVGSGLSSSAALEVATLRAACDLTKRDMTAVEIAVMARKAENEYVGVPCGIMDQYSVSVGSPGKAVFLDTRKLETDVVDLPDTHNFVIIHSGVTHKLSDDGYEQRVEQCTAACIALGVEMLSDLSIDDLERINALAAPLDGRARHIITENKRVYDALAVLKRGDLNVFSQLMTQSHASQRDDYEVSVPEVDALVEGCIPVGADAARLTGGGFGGSIVAFVQKARVPAFVDAIGDRFPDARVLAVT